MYKRNEAFRFELNPPISGVFQIVKIGEKEIQTKPGSMSVVDISPEGMKITTTFNIDLLKEVHIEVKFALNDVSLTYSGHLLWQKNLIDQFLYGVKMENDEQTKEQLVEELKIYAKRKKA